MVTAIGSKTGDWCNDSTADSTFCQCRFDSGVPHTKTKHEDDTAMNVLNKQKQISVISALAENASIRSVERMTGIHRDTIMRLGVRVGKACEKVLDKKCEV